MQPAPDHNQATYSVSEVSGALKRVVEDNFGYVRVRGEISGFKQAGSGHGYFALKDEKAVLDAVCWRGTMGRLGLTPEDGLEVIATGRLTTYPGRSRYQIVVEAMEPAGVGALMALLEKRKAALAAEGLFEEARKQPLPFLPRSIGVVTSPTGAVIRDILHRIADRFPCPVLVWPVLVQGEGAAQQIAAAIEGFNRLPEQAQDGGPVRPDVLIVARGGGSLEDLWAFNEEPVVRAVAASAIPVISAVGHETDTTLVDYAADRRAPTPTAAAEMAVPVRSEWRLSLLETGKRLASLAMGLLDRRRHQLAAQANALLNPARRIEHEAQRLDDRIERLHAAALACCARGEARLAASAARLLHPRARLELDAVRLERLTSALESQCGRMLQEHRRGLELQAAALSRYPWSRLLKQKEEALAGPAAALPRAALRVVESHQVRLERGAGLLESLSPMRVLERGYVLVQGEDGQLITRAAAVKAGQRVRLTFADAAVEAITMGKEPEKVQTELPL